MSICQAEAPTATSSVGCDFPPIAPPRELLLAHASGYFASTLMHLARAEKKQQISQVLHGFLANFRAEQQVGLKQEMEIQRQRHELLVAELQAELHAVREQHAETTLALSSAMQVERYLDPRNDSLTLAFSPTLTQTSLHSDACILT